VRGAADGVCVTLGWPGSNFGGAGEATGFDGGTATGDARAFRSVEDAATVLSPGFSATGAFTSRGMEVRNGTSALVGVCCRGEASGRGFSTGGVAGFAGAQFATPPSWTVPHQGQKVISFFCGRGGALVAAGCACGGLMAASAAFSATGLSITAGFSATMGFSTRTVCGFGGAAGAEACEACS